MTPVSENIITQLGALSYAGIWVTSLLANILIPVPEEIVLLALGYIVGTGALNGFIIMPLVISGLLLSDFILYSLTKRGSRIINWFYQKFFAKRIVKKGDEWVNQNIEKIIILSRFLIQLRFLGPFIAGQRKISWKKYVVYDLFALVIYVPIYILLGVYFHSKVKFIIDKVGVVRNIVLIVVGLLLLYALVKLGYRFLFKKSSQENAG